MTSNQKSILLPLHNSNVATFMSRNVNTWYISRISAMWHPQGFTAHRLRTFALRQMGERQESHWGHQQSSDFTERTCLNGISQRVTERNKMPSSWLCVHIHEHGHVHNTCMFTTQSHSNLWKTYIHTCMCVSNIWCSVVEEDTDVNFRGPQVYTHPHIQHKYPEKTNYWEALRLICV